MIPTAGEREREYFELAFKLAYFLHAERDVASVIAEDAVDALPSSVVLQGMKRVPANRLRGVLKWGERVRPVRRTTSLNESQMLQWLVYRQSEAWERETEAGGGPYRPTEEDLVVRYVEHLVYVTLRRSSFNVTLAVGSMLHQFNRREARLFYDVLTQSDPARIKDTSYIGKKRLELLEKLSLRFGDTLQTVNKLRDEKHVATRPATPQLVELVRECLRRFTPWDTTCVVKPGFDVTDIPELYFSDQAPQDEGLVELNRIHTVLDPECFRNFVEGLSKYVRSLPAEDQDKTCDFDSTGERLAVPLFSNDVSGPSRGDRSQPPALTKLDYVRLRRTLDARARRRRDLKPTALRVYVDDAQACTLDLRAARSVTLPVCAGAFVIEVRGADEAGEITLATLFLNEEQPGPEASAGSVEYEGGQKLTFTRLPARENRETAARLKIHYAEAGVTHPARRLLAAGRKLLYVVRGVSAGPVNRRWVTASASVLMMAAAAALLWQLFFMAPGRHHDAHDEQPGRGDDAQTQPGPQASASPPPAPAGTPLQARRQAPPAPARRPPVIAAWSTSREEALRAVAVETTRDENRRVDISGGVGRVYLSLPRYDDEHEQPYSRYRVSLSASGKRIWQQTLPAPKTGGKNSYYVMALTLRPQRLPDNGVYDVQVEAFGRGGWSMLGRLALSVEAP